MCQFVSKFGQYRKKCMGRRMTATVVYYYAKCATQATRFFQFSIINFQLHLRSPSPGGATFTSPIRKYWVTATCSLLTFEPHRGDITLPRVLTLGHDNLSIYINNNVAPMGLPVREGVFVADPGLHPGLVNVAPSGLGLPPTQPRWVLAIFCLGSPPRYRKSTGFFFMLVGSDKEALSKFVSICVNLCQFV